MTELGTAEQVHMNACLVRLHKLNDLESRLRVAQELVRHYKKQIAAGKKNAVDPRQQGLFDDDER